jgi:predicted phosphodiesterase
VKLHVLSDLHIEFAPFALPKTDADVIVLAGDIGVGTGGLEFAQSIAPGRPKIYVAGNHEYYGQALPHLTEKLTKLSAGTEAHFLEDREIILGDVRVLGCTLWTDFALFGEDRQAQAKDIARISMTDFHRIRSSPRFSRFSPDDAHRLHKRSRRWLQERLDAPFAGRTVVVTHHAPSPRSSAEKYREDLLSSAFVTDLEEMMDGDHVALWIHGHTHHCVDFTVRGTRVVSNQRGYPNEGVANFDPGFIAEV